ncbi:Uncharacterised protein [Legionella busanensis]|uniref:Uncharacterized protein n=1 Tax=Legionella busanensis TaxID=190655 RepID=A0A378JFK9_9GAMM|nr:hypothetical protein [Legionella busanensis]STX49965.1 Uncharacterised protein [Legionella busanensis]
MLSVQDDLKVINEFLAKIYPDYFSLKEPAYSASSNFFNKKGTSVPNVQTDLKNNSSCGSSNPSPSSIVKIENDIVLIEGIDDFEEISDELSKQTLDDFEEISDELSKQTIEDDFEKIPKKSPKQTLKENSLVYALEMLKEILKLNCPDECLDSTQIKQIKLTKDKILEVLNLEMQQNQDPMTKCLIMATIGRIDLLNKHISKIKPENSIKTRLY